MRESFKGIASLRLAMMVSGAGCCGVRCMSNESSPVLCQALDRAQVNMMCVGVVLWVKAQG